MYQKTISNSRPPFQHRKQVAELKYKRRHGLSRYCCNINTCPKLTEMLQ